MSACRCTNAGHGNGLWHPACAGKTEHGAALCWPCQLAGCMYNRRTRKVLPPDVIYYVKPLPYRERKRRARLEAERDWAYLESIGERAVPTDELVCA